MYQPIRSCQRIQGQVVKTAMPWPSAQAAQEVQSLYESGWRRVQVADITGEISVIVWEKCLTGDVGGAKLNAAQGQAVAA